MRKTCGTPRGAMSGETLSPAHVLPPELLPVSALAGIARTSGPHSELPHSRKLDRTPPDSSPERRSRMEPSGSPSLSPSPLLVEKISPWSQYSCGYRRPQSSFPPGRRSSKRREACRTPSLGPCALMSRKCDPPLAYAQMPSSLSSCSCGPWQRRSAPQAGSCASSSGLISGVCRLAGGSRRHLGPELLEASEDIMGVSAAPWGATTQPSSKTSLSGRWLSNFRRTSAGAPPSKEHSVPSKCGLGSAASMLASGSCERAACRMASPFSHSGDSAFLSLPSSWCTSPFSHSGSMPFESLPCLRRTCCKKHMREHMPSVTSSPYSIHQRRQK
mmetsp:Transcript_63975/g.198063  ORF Transcript_63975/g.198063 Transcript_63975/m.198063 type:complete len:330 (-) Transcript_63975:63-1052(-)